MTAASKPRYLSYRHPGIHQLLKEFSFSVSRMFCSHFYSLSHWLYCWPDCHTEYIPQGYQLSNIIFSGTKLPPPPNNGHRYAHLMWAVPIAHRGFQRGIYPNGTRVQLLSVLIFVPFFLAYFYPWTPRIFRVYFSYQSHVPHRV